MKKFLILFGFIASFFFGMLSYRNNWFPRPQLKLAMSYFNAPTVVFPYKTGDKIYTDREYVDSGGDEKLSSACLVQMPRHHKLPINIEFKDSVIVYRSISEANDNRNLKNWNLTDIKINIEGKSSLHNVVVSKIYGPGKHTLMPGGPVASNPIFIKSLLGNTVKSSVEIID